MGCALTVIAGRGRGRRFHYDADSVSIGRGAENDLVVNDDGVSRAHARIERRDDAWLLTDCGSANGTQLDRCAIAAPAELRDGDRIGVGTVVLQFDTTGGAAHREQTARRAFVAGSAALLLVTAAVIAAGRRRPAEAPPPQPVAAAVAPAAGGDPAGARSSYDRGRRRLEERRVAPRNLYDAWSAFVDARRALAGVTARPAFAADLDKRIDLCERELQRDCDRLLFAAARFEKYGQDEQALQIFREVLSRFPGDEPSGCRQRAQERLAATANEGAE